MSQTPPASILAPSRLATLNRLRKFSRLLDNAIGIPGTKFRIGLDPILGIIPGAGDFLGTVLSAYIVIEAARLGLPKETLAKMVSNIVLESAVGTLPVIGDLFDVVWKANIRNFELVEAHLNIPQEVEKKNRWFIFFLLAGLLIFSVGILAISVFTLKLLIGAITG